MTAVGEPFNTEQLMFWETLRRDNAKQHRDAQEGSMSTPKLAGLASGPRTSVHVGAVEQATYG
jgi:hypothetical protein